MHIHKWRSPALELMPFHPPPNHTMSNNLPDTCRRGQGPGDRHETDCMICTNTIYANTDTITHNPCGRTICATCFFAWARTAGPTATCPNCRGVLQSNQESRPNALVEMVAFLDQQQAESEAVFQVRVQAALAQRNSTDIATLVERLCVYPNNPARRIGFWTRRPNLVQDLQAAFDERQVARRATIEEELEDRDQEFFHEDWRQNNPGRRRTREQREARAAREVRRVARAAAHEAELQAVFDALNT